MKSDTALFVVHLSVHEATAGGRTRRQMVEHSERVDVWAFIHHPVLNRELEGLNATPTDIVDIRVVVSQPIGFFFYRTAM